MFDDKSNALLKYYSFLRMSASTFLNRLFFIHCSKSYRNTKHTQFQTRSQLRSNILRRLSQSKQRGGGYELIDLPTLSTGHCLLACGIRSYSVLHRVNASNCSIEFRPRSRPPRQPLTCHTRILSNLYRILCRLRHISNTTCRANIFCSYTTLKLIGTIKKVILQ